MRADLTGCLRYASQLRPSRYRAAYCHLKRRAQVRGQARESCTGQEGIPGRVARIVQESRLWRSSPPMNSRRCCGHDREAWPATPDYGFVDRITTPDETGIPGGIGGGARYPGHVIFYVGVPNVEAALAEAERLGGKRQMGPDVHQDLQRPWHVRFLAGPRADGAAVARLASGGHASARGLMTQTRCRPRRGVNEAGAVPQRARALLSPSSRHACRIQAARPPDCTAAGSALDQEPGRPSKEGNPVPRQSGPRGRDGHASMQRRSCGQLGRWLASMILTVAFAVTPGRLDDGGDRPATSSSITVRDVAAGLPGSIWRPAGRRRSGRRITRGARVPV
jgi:hypothetical protein